MNTIILRFDKNTLLLSEIMNCTMPDTVGSDTINVVISQEQYDYIIENKFLVGYNESTSELIYHAPKPSVYHKWNGTEWVEDTDEKIRIMTGNIRDFRLGKLQELDNLILNPLRFATYTDQQKAELAQYRQDLLDVPQQAGFPLDTVFPDKPTFIQ